jgi:hypothetical protein
MGFPRSSGDGGSIGPIPPIRRSPSQVPDHPRRFPSFRIQVLSDGYRTPPRTCCPSSMAWPAVIPGSPLPPTVRAVVPRVALPSRLSLVGSCRPIIVLRRLPACVLSQVARLAPCHPGRVDHRARPSLTHRVCGNSPLLTRFPRMRMACGSFRLGLSAPVGSSRVACGFASLPAPDSARQRTSLTPVRFQSVLNRG